MKIMWNFKHYSAIAVVLTAVTLILWLLWPRTDIEFNQGISQLTVTITTPRWLARSVQPQDKPLFEKLFTDSRIMPMLSDVEAFREDMIDHIFERRWLGKWQQNIPYSGFAIFDKKSQQFIGFMRIETTTNIPGQAEIAYAVTPEYQRKGLGTEMVQTLVHIYGQQLRDKQYLALGQPLEEIVATVRSDNAASQRVLEKTGFRKVGQVLNKDLFQYQF